jgi:predicted phosphodiesterase
MKILVLSDLHLEHGTSLTPPKIIDYDVVVLAGDIHSPGRRAVHWAKEDSTFGRKPVILVPGNHEFYNCTMDVELAQMKSAAANSNVHVLDREAVVIEGVRFIGCTLWTDFQIPVVHDDGTVTSDVGRALNEAARRMNDFRLIEVSLETMSPARGSQPRRVLHAADTLAMHWIDRDWLRRQLAEPFDGITVVVTHHAPARDSVAERFASSWVTPAFVSDLPATFFDVPALWVHGHTHSPFDYRRGACRVVSNPRGYGKPGGSFENRDFNAGFLAEVSVASRPSSLEGERPPALSNYVDLRAARTDMADSVEAAALAGVTTTQLRRWAAMKSPRVIALRHSVLGWRYPRWQFVGATWQLVEQLARALHGNGPAMLAWLETPLGALEGRTPRTALEQGEPVERMLTLAAGSAH